MMSYARMYGEIEEARDIVSFAFIEGSGQNPEVDQAVKDALNALRDALDTIADVGSQ